MEEYDKSSLPIPLASFGVRQKIIKSLGLGMLPTVGRRTQLFHLIFSEPGVCGFADPCTGSPILITPEGQYWEKGNFSTPKLDETEGVQCLGHSNWTICSPLSHFCLDEFPTFSLSYWGAHSYYPRGAEQREKRIIPTPQ